jgi:hypothetical protein
MKAPDDGLEPEAQGEAALFQAAAQLSAACELKGNESEAAARRRKLEAARAAQNTPPTATKP